MARVRSLCILTLLAALAAAAPAWAQITGTQVSIPNTADYEAITSRNGTAYDSVNQVYLVIVNRPPVTGRFVKKDGTRLSDDFVIATEPQYTAWASVAFGGPSNNPTFLVTYTLADLALNPKYGRLIRYNPASPSSPSIGAPNFIANATSEWIHSEKAQNVWDGQKFIIGTRTVPPGFSEPVAQVNHMDLQGNVSSAVILGDGLDYEGSPAISCAQGSVCMMVGFLAGINAGYSGGSYARIFDPNTLQPRGVLFDLAAGTANEDQEVQYLTHAGLFLTEWWSAANGATIQTRMVSPDGVMSPLDASKGIGPAAGTNTISYNAGTHTTLLINKDPAAELTAIELGDDGYPIRPGNVVVITPWDGSISDYEPTACANDADGQWLVTAHMGIGNAAQLVTGTKVSSAPLPPNILNAATLPAGTVNQPYTEFLTAIGSAAPFTWSLSSGTLPPGVNLVGSSLTGTPTAPATYNFTVRATGTDAVFTEKALSLLINPIVVVGPGGANAHIEATPVPSTGVVSRNNVAYDSVNQVYLIIDNRPPVTGKFVNKNGQALTGDFVIATEPQYTAWASVAFGGPSNDPTFLVTYTLADLQLNPKFGRLVRYNAASPSNPSISAPSFITNSTTEWVQSEKAQNFWTGSQWVVGTRIVPGGFNEPVAVVSSFDINGNVSAPVILGDGLDYEGSPSVACGGGTCMIVGFLAGIPNGYTGGSYARLFDASTLAGKGNLFSLAMGIADQDQEVVYQAHTGNFLTEWWSADNGANILTRLVSATGAMSTLDFSKEIGPGSGTNAICYNAGTQTTLLMNKNSTGGLSVMELGDDGYLLHPDNVKLVTNWDGQTSDYEPSCGVNSADGQWLVTAHLGNGSVAVLVQGAVVTQNPGAPTITTSATLPSKPINSVYSQALTATGGATPYTWTLQSGSLPTGVTVQGASLAGTATVAGTFNFRLRVTGADSLYAEQDFTLTILPSLLVNGTFLAAGGGSANWQEFALPDMSGITWNVTNGVFQFYRTGTQAVVFQDTGTPVVSGGPVQAQFDLGNSSNAVKTISVLLQNDDFADLQLCRFTLQPNAPLRTYVMKTHTTQAWSSAMISFYAATVGSDGGFYQISNVAMSYQPNNSATRTECVDPTAPSSGSGVSSGELITNGGFDNGLTGWSTFGQISAQVSNGVMQFFKLAGAPSGVVLQPTGQTMTSQQGVSSTFQLGNSSGVRQRVVVLVHDLDFSDVQACVFWLAPNSPLANYGVTTYATKAWTNTTFSVYPSTVGVAPDNQWLLLYNVSVKRTTAAIMGTQCFEPASGVQLQGNAVTGSPASATDVPGVVSSAPKPPSNPFASGSASWAPDGFELAPGAGSSTGFRAVASDTSQHVLTWNQPVDLSATTSPHLTFQSWLAAAASTAEVQVSADGGVSWSTVADVDPSLGWTGVDVDLSAYAGQIVYIRFVFDGVAPDDPIQGVDEWQIDQVQIDPSGHVQSARRHD